MIFHCPGFLQRCALNHKYPFLSINIADLRAKTHGPLSTQKTVVIFWFVNVIRQMIISKNHRTFREKQLTCNRRKIILFFNYAFEYLKFKQISPVIIIRCGLDPLNV